MKTVNLHRPQKSVGGGKNARQYVLVYTVLFALVCLFVFHWHFFTGRTLIYDGDGWGQHYKALVYYGKYLRTILQNLISKHQLIIPAWDFSIGEGSDVLQTLHYYVIGDPFTVLSALVPVNYMYLYFEAMVILRLYLSGLAFSWLCFGTGRTNRYGVLAGAFSYTFFLWSFTNAAKHPYFLNPMLWFPLIILGLEKLLKRERPYLYVVSVFFAAVSNFYFFWMIVVLTVVYVLVRMGTLYGLQIRKWAVEIGRILVFSLLALALAAIVFLPVSLTFLGDARLAADNAYHFVYPPGYYLTLPAMFISSASGFWLQMGYTAPVLLAVFLLFVRRKEHTLLKGLFLAGLAIILVPFFGQVLNGFGYVCNRWCWAFALLNAYILATMWPRLMELDKREFRKLFICTCVYAAVCMLLERSRNRGSFWTLLICLAFLIVNLPLKDWLFSEKSRRLFSLLTVFVCICTSALWEYADSEGAWVQRAVSVQDIQENFFATDAAAVASVAAQEDEVFVRYAQQKISKNTSMFTDLSCTGFYWTLTNPYINRYRADMEMVENRASIYYDYEDRTAMTTLASVKYLAVAADSRMLPYGFTYVSTIDVKEPVRQNVIEELKQELQVEELSPEHVGIVNGISLRYDIYRNDNTLPLGYTYDGYMAADAWREYDAVDKQEILLQEAVVENYDGALAEKTPELTAKTLDYTVTCNSPNVTQNGNSFTVTKKNSSVTLNFEGLPDSETYLSIRGLEYKDAIGYDLYFGDESADPLNLFTKTMWKRLPYDERYSMTRTNRYRTDASEIEINMKASTGKSRLLTHRTKEASYYNGRTDYTVNLDYSEEPATSITISFEFIGTYSFDELVVKAQPMTNYKTQVTELKREALENLQIGTDLAEGTVSLAQPKFLCLTIPYSKGWEAYVDGEKAQLYQTNVMYMGLDLAAGEHSIRLVYHTPFLRAGALVSLCALVLSVILVILREKRGQLLRK